MGTARKIELSRDVERDEYLEQYHNPEKFNSGTINLECTPNCLWYCDGRSTASEGHEAYESMRVHV
jgi:hypothetical protein